MNTESDSEVESTVNQAFNRVDALGKIRPITELSTLKYVIGCKSQWWV